jgi:hypothetical protein
VVLEEDLLAEVGLAELAQGLGGGVGQVEVAVDEEEDVAGAGVGHVEDHALFSVFYVP